MCGGTIEFTQGDTIGICDSCGTKQTLPYLGDEKRANLYDRANHFRRNNDYDKAMGIYETILNEDLTDAEAYWSILLCKYGIEYVEDPTTHKYLPTINRAQYTSIFEDEDYKSAIKNATVSQKEIYESEANTINEIQKGILEISSKEEPFDVFICYKETDNNGRRTPDSVLATELYHELTKEGFKVFFSRITLEDKLGTAYEPYIFAALNSAKVMVVLGTKPEYFNAVWVKNEWSRYLALIKNGAKKVLIPAYRDMNPYDLPEEFSHLQAQDMSKLGFMQDLIRGIKKVITDDSKNIVVNNPPENNMAKNTDVLLDRAFILLEQKSWKQADLCFEQVLNDNPKNSEAYLGKCMVDLCIGRKDELIKQAKSVLKNKNYKFAIRFADYRNGNELKNINDRMEKIVKAKAKKAKKRLKISALSFLTLMLITAMTILVIIPFVRYFVINNKLSNNQTEYAVSYYKNWQLIDYDFLIESVFEKKAKLYEEKTDYKNASICYLALKNNEKYKKCMYAYGLENVSNENYSVAEKTFKEIKKYQDSEKYYYYSKGRVALNNNSVKAYDYFCECRNFNDTEKQIQNTEWLKKLECLQGSWELLTTSENYPTYEAAKSAPKKNSYSGSIVGTVEYTKKFRTVKITKSVVESEFIPALSVKRLNENFDIISSDKFVYNSENKKYTVVRKK